MSLDTDVALPSYMGMSHGHSQGNVLCVHRKLVIRRCAVHNLRPASYSSYIRVAALF